MDALTLPRAIETLNGMHSPHRAHTIATTTVAAVVAVALVAGIIALALINPNALIGLPPVLLAVAAIVRAITGTCDHPATIAKTQERRPYKVL